MRLLDVYALSCGAKINEPFIYASYFPLPLKRYITFQAQSQQNLDAKNYSYWQDVIDMILPVLLKHDIRILQVGQAHEQAYQNIFDLRGKTDVHQLAYLIKGGMLHFGPDSFGIHLASSYNVPLVGLYSSTMPEIAGPHFGDKDKQVVFKGYERVNNGKPAYALQEDPKSINSIKPEEIANAIFKLLNLNSVVPVETVFTGKRYSSQIIRELIPNNPGVLSDPNNPVEIRADLHLDENLLGHHLTYLNKAVIVTDKPLNIKLLKHFKPHIPILVYRIKEQDNPEFIREVVNSGFNALLLSELHGEELAKKKISYYEFGQINEVGAIDTATVESLRKDIDKLYFRSCKYIASQGKLFASYASEKAGKDIQNQYDYQKVIDSDEFWKDLDFYTIVKKLD
jgi:hypothetical protein